jgi:outer membrane protein OmpA-like peptidoglycan-associated protein
MRYQLFISVSCILLLITAVRAFAQIPEQEIIKLQNAVEQDYSYGDSELFDFPNVNKLAYYVDSKQIRKIRHYNERKDWQNLLPSLQEYVGNFGIANFYRSTYWLWRLAKVTELFGNEDEARLIYALALKHYRNNIDVNAIELHYDSLTINIKDYYVPLDYYYELVEYRKQVDTLRPPRGVLLNMGRAINSPFADYGPTISVEDELMIFTSRRDISRNPLTPDAVENLYMSKKYGGAWEIAEPMNGINSALNEGSACLSKNGKQLFFARQDAPDGFGSTDLYYSTLQDDSTWSKAVNLGINVNSGGWDSHPALTHSEDTLYFASDRIGGFGLSDIYFTVKGEDGFWQEAKNIGPIINTRQNELSPFYHHRDDVLYFSSNNELLNFGEYDIYKTYKKKGNWIEPKNIGPLVNGPGSEFYFTIDSKSENLYYARSAENNLDNLDLYSFPLPMEAQPDANTRLTGKISNEETGQPIRGIVSIIDLDNGIEVAPKYLRPDGTFEFDLINDNNYLIIVQGDSFFRIGEIFHLDEDTDLTASIKPLSTKIKFESIVFGNGEATLTVDMYDDLDKIVDFLLDNPEFQVKISGHTDSDGREEFNLQLSQKRADAIMEYMVYFGGVDEQRIIARGFGSSQPIIRDHTEEAKRLNRRVEFELYRN